MSASYPDVLSFIVLLLQARKVVGILAQGKLYRKR